MSNLKLNDLVTSINKEVIKGICIMEVCGTHTQVIAKAGLSELLDSKIRLISGPGCPVCVTTEGYIDAAIELLAQKNVIIATFGDMVRVRGSRKSLEDCMEMKNRIRVVYSPFAALEIAAENSSFQVVFLAVGFETTTPLIAAVIKYAQDKNINNLSFLLGLKLMPGVLKQVLSSSSRKIDALICPGHVSVIMGSDYFNFIHSEFGIPTVVSGFEYSDIVSSVECLTKMVCSGSKGFMNLYARCVKPQGNRIAKDLIKEIFYEKEGYWRGIGRIDNSELILNEEYNCFDASLRFDVKVNNLDLNQQCNCGEIIIGNKFPFQCSMFAKDCTIENPMGPCMVSSEGACAIYYKYRRSL